MYNIFAYRAQLAVQINHDAEQIKAMAYQAMFWDPKDSEAIKSSPSRMFREQLQVFECAVSLLWTHFGDGDGFQRCLQCVEEPEYLMGLIYDWHDMIHWSGVEGFIEEDESPSSFCCYCSDARDMSGGTEELVSYARDDMAFHLFEMHEDREDESWKPMLTEEPPGEFFTKHRPGCIRGRYYKILSKQ